MVAHMVQVVYYAVTWATFKPKIKIKKSAPKKKIISGNGTFFLNKT